MRVIRVRAEDSLAQQRRAAGALARRGLRPGDRIAVVAASSAEYLAVVIGALRRGIVPVLLNPTLLPAEQALLLEDAQPAVVLRDADLVDLCGGPPVELADAPLVRPMLYTSGTTGRPKGVWSGILEESAARAALEEERDVWGFNASDVHLVVSPLHHSAPIRFSTGTLLAGGDVVLAAPFDAGVVANAIAMHRPSSAFVVPAHLQRLLALPELPPLESFRLVAHAGAPCPEALKRCALGLFPRGSLWEFYGSTEGQFTVCSPEEWELRPGTVGKARPHRQLRIADGGIIWCRVPDYARFEYWRDPAKTAEAWDADWFTVRDLGRMDDEGYLYLDGRRDDLIITGGVNVYPVEVERAILSHPDVVSAAVFPLPDEKWGDMVCAAVVGKVEPEDVAAWLGRRLAPYKRPKRIVRVDSIPLSSMGKVKRSELAVQLGMVARDTVHRA